MSALHLVRHGRPVLDPAVPAHAWELDPAGFDDVWAVRDRLPVGATWFCSPEPKAIQTAQLLTDAEVGVVDDLREQGRSGWVDDLAGLVRDAFARPDLPAYDGWESVTALRARIVRTVATIWRLHGSADVVLVGHGTAWTALLSALTGDEPDLERLRSMPMPALITLPGHLAAASLSE
ncbi:MAG: hypothetical protein F2667_05810 [Actinobacteria bacterium]|uniref:Unannotated protein n=1 Tax=freshwater metagenome TaxID=449393 RepID=A0A6J6PZI6_9ZZZZ|nr:hypothetical protein [Actinomycetota bacterium]